MSRLRKKLLSNRTDGLSSLGIFTTVGYPTLEDTDELLTAAADGGADFLELGLPFSDPLAEGPTIQRSSERALSSGVTLRDAFRVAELFCGRNDTPLAFMGYVNPLLRYGPGNFFRDARSSGVDAVILPDLPPEEAGEIREQADAAGVDLIFLVAPTTPDKRVQWIDTLSSGFVYAVSVTGVTGSSMGGSDAVVGYLDRIRGLVQSNPVLVGFGIANHGDVERLSAHADGCIVGSAFIREVEAVWRDPDLDTEGRRHAVRSYVHELKYGRGAM